MTLSHTQLVPSHADELKVLLETLKLQHGQLQQLETTKSQQLSEALGRLESNQQSRKELLLLEETVARELQVLHNLRKHFVRDLCERIKVATQLFSVASFLPIHLFALVPHK